MLGGTLLHWRAAGCFVGDSEADRKLAQFCADVGAGDSPDPEYLKLVGVALQHFLESDDKTEVRGGRVGKALGVDRKRGKARSTQKEWRDQAYAVAAYLENLETMGEEAALRTAAAKYKIGVRAMQNRIKKHMDGAIEIREIDAQFRRAAAAIGASLGSVKDI